MTETSEVPPAAVTKALNDRMRQYPGGGTWFTDDHGFAILDDALPGLPNADARGAARWLRRTHPELWTNESKPVSDTKAAPVPAVTSTAADLMAAVKSGSVTADEATRRLLAARPAETRPAPGIPDTPTFAGGSMTALMARVRSGDRSALADITARYLNPKA